MQNRAKQTNSSRLARVGIAIGVTLSVATMSGLSLAASHIIHAAKCVEKPAERLLQSPLDTLTEKPFVVHAVHAVHAVHPIHFESGNLEHVLWQPEPLPARPEGAGKSAENNPLQNELTAESEQAIARGLAALARSQEADGSFGGQGFGQKVAVTSLSCLALMADGNIPGRGAYGEVVRKGLEYVLTNSSETGLLATQSTSNPMYGHGFAALFLGEIHGMTPGGADTESADRLHRALLRAVQLIERSQNDEGGWRYNPVAADADVSVTICQIMALRSARNAGLEVSKGVIDRAVEYVRRLQNADGGFRYQMTQGPSAWPRSAAGVASLYYAGIYEDRAIDTGLKYLIEMAMPGRAETQQIHFFYGHYYAVQAMFLAGGDNWAKWWPAIRDLLLREQNPNGRWEDASAGEQYGTAMALIILQMPKRYLPIFQK